MFAKANALENEFNANKEFLTPAEIKTTRAKIRELNREAGREADLLENKIRDEGPRARVAAFKARPESERRSELNAKIKARLAARRALLAERTASLSEFTDPDDRRAIEKSVRRARLAVLVQERELKRTGR